VYKTLTGVCLAITLAVVLSTCGKAGPSTGSTSSDTGADRTVVEPGAGESDMNPIPPRDEVTVPEDPRMRLEYEPYNPPEIPHTERCLFAGDPLCDPTIEVPGPNLDNYDW
jgi:hypothetical protein